MYFLHLYSCHVSSLLFCTCPICCHFGIIFIITIPNEGVSIGTKTKTYLHLIYFVRVKSVPLPVCKNPTLTFFFFAQLYYFDSRFCSLMTGSTKQFFFLSFTYYTVISLNSLLHQVLLISDYRQYGV